MKAICKINFACPILNLCLYKELFMTVRYHEFIWHGNE